MTEITRVPLLPIAKGSLPKIWIGLAAIALAAGGLAWSAIPAGVDVDTLVAGNGGSPTATDVALINYRGTLPDGKEFDKGEKAVMPLSQVVPGFTMALLKMQRGGKYKVVIPSELGYGPQGKGPIPGDTDLTFEIELLDFISQEQFDQQRAMMEQMQQMQGGQGGPGGPGAQGAPGGVPMPQGAPVPQGAAPR